MSNVTQAPLLTEVIVSKILTDSTGTEEKTTIQDQNRAAEELSHD